MKLTDRRLALFATGLALGLTLPQAPAPGTARDCLSGDRRGHAAPAFLSRPPAHRALTIADLRAMAHRRLPRFALEYLEGGAEDEATLARNLAALAEWRFRHRSFVDVSQVDLSATLFGRRMAMPLAVAPTGLNGLFWPHADLRLAEAAAKAGIPFAQSTMSNEAMEAVARVPGCASGGSSTCSARRKSATR